LLVENGSIFARFAVDARYLGRQRHDFPDLIVVGPTDGRTPV
jgi:hypothetical protein